MQPGHSGLGERVGCQLVGEVEAGLLLIGGRVAQGVGAALLSPAALSTITSIFHGEERNKALSVWASLGGIGFAAGVLIGGILTAGPGWRWVFFINVPVGIVLLAAIPAVVPQRRPHRTAGRIDVLGAVTVPRLSQSKVLYETESHFQIGVYIRPCWSVKMARRIR